MSEDVKFGRLGKRLEAKGITDFLSDPGKCAEYVSGLLVEQKNNFGLNLGWDHGLHERKEPEFVPSPILVHHVEQANPEYYQELKHDINLKLQGEEGVDDLEVNNMIFHVMTDNAWINWPCDESETRQGAITIYLNTPWGLDKGGEFLYNVNNEVERVTPTFNTGMFIRGGVQHRTTPVHGHNLRKSLQVWLKEKG